MKQKIIPSQPVLIIGGGRGGLAFLELFREEELFHVIGVTDHQENAPAMLLAKALGIPTFLDAKEALNACMPCTAFNLTHDETISGLAANLKEHCSIIGGLEATLIWKMVVRLKETSDKFRENQAFTQSIISNAMDGIILINTRGLIQSYNPAAELMFGYSQEEVVGKNISMLMPEPDKSGHDGYLKRYMSTKDARVVGIERQVIAQRKNGQTFPMSLSVNEMQSGSEHYFIGIVSDITSRVESEESIKKLAHFDVVTDLPNRALYFDRLKRALARAKRYKKELAVLFLDLDGFKAVNDNYGHDIGDLLLHAVSARLTKVIREMDTVARFGGDEFAFVINDIEDFNAAGVVAKKILAELAEPFVIEGKVCKVGGCIGISLFPKNALTVPVLIRQADMAMYEVKHNGKNNFCFFDGTEEGK